MEMTLFMITCQERDCGHSFYSSSREHTSCPSCGNSSLVYEGGSIEVEIPFRLTEDYLDVAIESKEDLALAVVIANAYLTDSECVARYEDCSGFSLDLENTNFLEEMVAKFGFETLEEFEDWVEDIYDVHAHLIYDPIFPCIERDHYTDESGDLFESGWITSRDSQIFYRWIQNHPERVESLLKTEH